MPSIYVDVVLPLALPPLTYAGGKAGGGIAPGSYVSVPLGRRKVYTGVVWRVHDTPPAKGKPKPILRIERDIPPVPEAQMKFWEWLAQYYMVPLGLVAKMAMAAPFKATGTLGDSGDPDNLDHSGYSGFPGRTPVKLPTVKVIGLGPAANDAAALEELFAALKKAKAQHRALTSIVEVLGVYTNETPDHISPEKTAPFQKTVPLKYFSISHIILKKLLEREAIRIDEVQAPPGVGTDLPDHILTLTPSQQAMFRSLAEAAKKHQTVLLRSDDMFPSLAAMRRTVRAGRNALLVVPELTPEHPLVDVVKEVFGETAIVYLPTMSERKKAQVCLRLAQQDVRPAEQGTRPSTQQNIPPPGTLMIGSRQALFLPYPRLDLVVVAAEHEPLYKQGDYAPFVNTKDAALMLAALYGARAILQSSTPSLESWFNAVTGRYGLVEGAPTSENIPAPASTFTSTGAPSPTIPAPARILISDTLRAAKRGERHNHLNHDLTQAIDRALAGGGQVVLFQNRRGYSTMIECEACGWGPRCPHCNVGMVLHQGGPEPGKHGPKPGGPNLKQSGPGLKCHYCGAQMPIPSRCPECSAPLGESKGFGTEKIEAIITQLYPGARVARLDSDSAPSASRQAAIIRDFRSGKTDILVGTQMLLHEFYQRPVAVAGLLNIDNVLGMPDFRAAERTVQLVRFFARHSAELIIQTSQPDNPTLLHAASGDYRAMAEEQLSERRQFFYPPYCRLVSVRLAHAEREELWNAAQSLLATCRRLFGEEGVQGPVVPTAEKAHGCYVVELLIKVPRENSFRTAKERLSEALAALTKAHKGIEHTVNVDPQ